VTKASEIDFETFVELQNVIDGYDTPKLHLRIIRWLEDTADDKDRLLQIFRGAGKSHLVSLYVVWQLLRDEDKTIMIMSAKRDLASRNVRFIKKIIETNPLTSKLRGTGAWRDTLFFVDRERTQLNPSVTCSSAESDFIGQHSNLLIIDDIETDKNSITERQREELRAVIAEFMSLAERRLYIGTPHGSPSIYTHLENMDYPMLKIAWTPDAWPDHPTNEFTVKWAERYKKQNPSWKWNSQYLLQPDSPQQALIDINMVIKYAADLKTTKIFGETDAQNTWEVRLNNARVVDCAAYWDPASGRTIGRDRSALAIVYKDTENNVYLHRLAILPPISEVDGFAPQCSVIVNHCIELGIARVTVEKSVSPTLHTELRNAAKERNHWLHVVSEPRTRNKVEFIASTIEPIVNSKRFYVHKDVTNQFFIELNEFPRAKHDDCIDATAGAIDCLRGDVMMIGDATLIPVRVNPARSVDFNKKGNTLSRF